jgi:hypothetical protein
MHTNVDRHTDVDTDLGMDFMGTGEDTDMVVSMSVFVFVSMSIFKIYFAVLVSMDIKCLFSHS